MGGGGGAEAGVRIVGSSCCLQCFSMGSSLVQIIQLVVSVRTSSATHTAVRGSTDPASCAVGHLRPYSILC